MIERDERDSQPSPAGAGAQGRWLGRQWGSWRLAIYPDLLALRQARGFPSAALGCLFCRRQSSAGFTRVCFEGRDRC